MRVRKLLLTFFLLAGLHRAHATGEPSTYFQIYVPPNNDPVRRDVSLIITAIYDSTRFEIIDDGADGDTDDSKSGVLMAGQSYVLYIKDNGINDDARYASGGVLKWDGDYFIVKSDKLVFASQSTNSDWQHDWVPSTDKKSIGQKFVIYSPPFTSSKRDINVFPYYDNTTVVFQKISWQPKTNSGFTDVDIDNPTTVFSRKLNIGEDIIYKYPDGRDAMGAGETYMIISDKPITVQYGALFGNERDGGGYVPTSNGSSSGELMYFAVPYQSGGEQEIRMVSWDDTNNIKLERYFNGNWVTMNSYSLNKMKAAAWVGKSNGGVSYATVFRISCTPGKRVSVFEGNWFETGSPGTSDMATMVSAENGTTSGLKFLTYMAPPGNEQNVINPFTGKAFAQQLTHLYIFSKDGAVVNIKDAATGGTRITKKFTIQPGRYADCFLTLTEWQSIQQAGPYLTVESDKPVSVMNTNFNDNWMCYTGSPLVQSFSETATINSNNAIPTDTLKITTSLNINTNVNNPDIQVIVGDGLKVVSSNFTASNTGTIPGTITEQTNRTLVDYHNVPDCSAANKYKVETVVIASTGSNDGSVLNKPINTTVETVVSGTVNGQLEQSSATQVVNINPNNTSKLIFSRFTDSTFFKDSTDSWTASWADVNNDGFDDIFVTDRRSNKPNILYYNNKKGGFTKADNTPFVTDTAISITGNWADIDNDGDLDLLVINNTRKPNTLYRNNNGILTRDNQPEFVQSVSYYHGGAFADYDNDGNLDLFLCNYFPTKYNELYRNNGKGGYVKELANAIPLEANQSIGPTWADYDADGYPDLFVPNGNGFKNSLFHNEGNGTFKRADNVISNEGGQSVGSCWGDYDNDGDLDLFVTNSNSKGNFLYRNEGNGKFSKVTTGVAVTDKGASHGCSFADIDNDGDLDLYVTNDRGVKFLYLNDGKGDFSRKTDEVISFDFGKSLGHSWSDYDKDGDLDLVVATHSGQPNSVFLNNGNANNWIELNLTGTVSNKSAIGAVISINTKGKWQMRELCGQSGFGGQNSFTQHFGTGDATVIDSIKIKWPSGVVQVLTNIPSKQVLNITENAAVKIAGGIFFDANNNCSRDKDEELVGNAVVRLAGSDRRIYTSQDGLFTAFMPVGNYELEAENSRNINKTCSPVICKIPSLGSTPDSLWIPATMVCKETDLEVLMGSTAIRKGFSNNQFNWLITNNGRKAATAVTAKLKLPATIVPATPGTPFSNVETVSENGISKKIYSWSIPTLPAFGSSLLSFMHSNETGVAIGDTIAFSSWIETSFTDCNTANNSLLQNYVVVGAIDPNDIAVTPVGYGKEGFIMPSQMLTYTIRFQNTGNHPASHVRITDNLPEGLDVNTLKLLASSHENVSVQNKGNSVVFEFPDIFLPDSAHNAEASQGYISFTISPKAGVQPGTRLPNAALIQFDEEEGITTNEVLNTIQSKKQEQQYIVVKTYPNPAADVLYVSLEHLMGKFTRKNIRRVELMDFFGRTVISKYFAAGEETRMDLPRYLQGIFLVKVTDSEDNIYTKQVIVRRQ